MQEDFPTPGEIYIDMYGLSSNPDEFRNLNKGLIKIIRKEIGGETNDFNIIVGF